MAFPLLERLKLAALFALLLGMLLLDRGFANWRNDDRDFPDQNGNYLPAPPDAPPQTYIEKHHLMKAMGYTGVGLIALSIVLFGIRVDAPDGKPAL